MANDFKITVKMVYTGIVMSIIGFLVSKQLEKIKTPRGEWI